jgi:hypothetical protein
MRNCVIIHPLHLELETAYTKDCLTCHGSPVGQIDISGYPKEGAEEGDLAGAISVSVPMGEPEGVGR